MFFIIVRREAYHQFAAKQKWEKTAICLENKFVSKNREKSNRGPNIVIRIESWVE